MMSAEARNIDQNGFHIYGEIINKEDVSTLYKKMLSTRNFGQSLFLSEESYLSQQRHFGTNPTKEFNFLNQFSNELNPIENNKIITNTLNEILGDDYEIVIKKAICGVPDSWLPDWIKQKINGVNVANLGPYIKQEYRDITYFRGIDFHQDIIDWPEGSTTLSPSTFLTLYVYLHDVNQYDSPLHILPGTHKHGSTLFPHKLQRKNGHTWFYEDDQGRSVQTEDKKLIGGQGFVGLWHNCLLHGTQPVQHESEKFRLSLRYLIAKSNNNTQRSGINVINENVDGVLSPIRTRRDLDKRGRAKLKGNIINSN